MTPVPHPNNTIIEAAKNQAFPTVPFPVVYEICIFSLSSRQILHFPTSRRDSDKAAYQVKSKENLIVSTKNIFTISWKVV